MDEFRRYMRRVGKKAHVVEGLIAQVRQFEAWLARERGSGLEAAKAGDLEAYAADIEAHKPGEARKRIRGIALYYGFSGNAAMAARATDIRERAIARTRRPFALEGFRGVDQEDIARLRAAGIVHVEHMLAAGRTPADRQRLTEETGVSPDAILELVKLSDLSRIGAVKSVRARLYHDAGVDTPAAMAQWEPEALREMLIDFVQRTGFEGIAPLPKEIRHAVRTARELPEIVEY